VGALDEPFDSSSLHDFFDSAYDGGPPWDIGGPQPDLIALLDQFPPASPALDVGCGTGDLTFALADRGWHVPGIDSAKVAIPVRGAGQGE
jgi:SAM-dependent methyltransferase